MLTENRERLLPAQGATEVMRHVLLLGGTGIGKSVACGSNARAASGRHEPFEAVDRSAFSPSLVEDELFGHERSAARKRKRGQHRLYFLSAARRREKRVRAFDLETGATLWSVRVPSSANGTPMTYRVNGRQYVVGGVE